MKKIFAIFISVLILGLSGCGKTAEPVNNPEPTPPESGEKEVIKHEIGAEADIEGCSEASEFSYDFDGDGEEDLLKLFTSAEIIDGELHGDDRNRWVVTVETVEGTYKLYDNYIQLGEVDVEIGEFYNEDIDRAVIMTITSNAGKSITHFIYHDDVFIEETVYSTDYYSQNGVSIFKTIE